MQKDKTRILNPLQHIKLNQQLTTITEELEELKSRKEQLKGAFGKYYDYHRRDIAADEVDCLNVENFDVFSIVHRNLNIKGNRRCDEISLLELRKNHMIWNCDLVLL